MNSILLIGAGGHARSIIDIIQSTHPNATICLVGKPHEVGTSVLGCRVLGTDDDLPKLREQFNSAVLAVGQLPDSRPRRFILHKIHDLFFDFPVLISAHAVVSKHSQISPGTVIGHGVIINSNSVIGSHCIINSCALIEHDVKIADHCHVSTGALVNGGVVLGEGCFVGSGAILREHLSLPSDTIISAGKRVMGWPLS